MSLFTIKYSCKKRYSIKATKILDSTAKQSNTVAEMCKPSGGYYLRDSLRVSATIIPMCPIRKIFYTFIVESFQTQITLIKERLIVVA